MISEHYSNEDILSELRMFVDLDEEDLQACLSQIEEVDDKTTILSVKMQGQEHILVFVLGFGANCEVLEPDWLKENVVDVITRMRLSYEQR